MKYVLTHKWHSFTCIVAITLNSADIGQTKSQSGAAVGASNFREDLNVDGFINSADISLAKSKSGTGL